MQKGFAPVLTLLLIVVFSIFGLLIYINQTKFVVQNQQVTKSAPTPTPDPKADWQIYQNKELGFSFRHPANWKVNTFQNNGDYNRGFTLINEKDQEILTMYDSSAPNWIGCEDFPERVDKTVQIGKQITTAIFVDNGKVVNTCKALEVVVSKGRLFNMEARYFNSNSADLGVEVLKTIEGIIVIQNNVDETANWKTYTNNKYGFKFNYPEYLNIECCNVDISVSVEREHVVTVAEYSSEREGTDAPFNGIGFKVYLNPNRLSLEQFIKEQKENIRGGFGCNDGAYKDEDILTTIGGQKGTLLRGYCNQNDIILVTFPNNQNILMILESNISGSNFDDTFRGILNSFKFLK